MIQAGISERWNLLITLSANAKYSMAQIIQSLKFLTRLTYFGTGMGAISR